MKESTFRYTIVASVIDTLFMVQIWTNFLAIILNFNPSATACKCFAFLSRIWYTFYPWINATNSIDRIYQNLSLGKLSSLILESFLLF